MCKDPNAGFQFANRQCEPLGSGSPGPLAANSRMVGSESALVTKLACGRLSDVQMPMGKLLSARLTYSTSVRSSRSNCWLSSLLLAVEWGESKVARLATDQLVWWVTQIPDANVGVHFGKFQPQIGHEQFYCYFWVNCCECGDASR